MDERHGDMYRAKRSVYISGDNWNDGDGYDWRNDGEDPDPCGEDDQWPLDATEIVAQSSYAA